MAHERRSFGGPDSVRGERLEVIETLPKTSRRGSQARGARRQSREFAQQSLFVPAAVASDLRAGSRSLSCKGRHESQLSRPARFLECRGNFWFDCWRKAKLPFHRWAHTRRIYARDVLAYKAKTRSVAAKSLDVLARAEYADGLYSQNTGRPLRGTIMRNPNARP